MKKNIKFLKNKMDLFDITIPISERPYDQMDHAILLSEGWKGRAKLIKSDLTKMLTKKIKNIAVIPDEDFEKISKELQDIDEIYKINSEIDSMLNRSIEDLLSTDMIERLCSFEKFLYKTVVTEDVINRINEEKENEEIKQKKLNDLVIQIDEMWDNNDSEETIKERIYEVFKDIYSVLNEEQINRFVTSFYIVATSEKPVRINLSSIQISSLNKKVFELDEEITCGTCLNEFQKGEEFISLPCDGSHSFHPDCIIPWLKMSVKCPTCRTDLRNYL